MTFGEAIQECFRKYAVFTGRASRSEFWWFALFGFVAIFVATMISEDLGTLVWLGLLLPYLAVLVRRLHDRGRSGWFLLISLIPIVGNIWMLIELASLGDEEANRYGPVPATSSS